MAKAKYYEDPANMGFVGGLFPDAKGASERFIRLDPDGFVGLHELLLAIRAGFPISQPMRLAAADLLSALDAPEDKKLGKPDPRAGGEF